MNKLKIRNFKSKSRTKYGSHFKHNRYAAMFFHFAVMMRTFFFVLLIDRNVRNKEFCQDKAETKFEDSDFESNVWRIERNYFRMKIYFYKIILTERNGLPTNVKIFTTDVLHLISPPHILSMFQLHQHTNLVIWICYQHMLRWCIMYDNRISLLLSFNIVMFQLLKNTYEQVVAMNRNIIELTHS